MQAIYNSLVEIVGPNYVSDKDEEKFFYARDPGLMPDHEPDYVVAPKTSEEVQKIVDLANKQKVPITPMGAGMSLAGLTIPLKGGIVIDMKRMNKILEVNENARYAIVEGGVSQGFLKAYLDKNHPHLQHSMPDSPPTTTIVANLAIHGQGHLSQQHGFNSDMATGLEVVLPTGEICNVGSCAMSPYWFSKGPSLPDLSGLFLGWIGATGIITKAGIKLYPKKKIRDFEIFVTDRANLVPDIILKLTHTEMVEGLGCLYQETPAVFKGNHLVVIHFCGDDNEEMQFKRKMIWRSLRQYRDSKDGGFMLILPLIKSAFLEMPMKHVTLIADEHKGGGFEYSGPIFLTEKYPILFDKVKELATKYGVTYVIAVRIIDNNRAMMFAVILPFNRADDKMKEKIKKALYEWSAFAFENGGIPWKPTMDDQKLAMKKIDNNTLKLMKTLKKQLDPNGIMNPGNWEVE